MVCLGVGAWLAAGLPKAHTEASMNLTSRLFRLARVSASVRALRSPRTASRRAKNIVVGRVLAKSGFWRRLWK